MADEDEENDWDSNINQHKCIFITRQIRYFIDDYDKVDSLGEPGTFGTAYKCYRKTDKNQTTPFAVKEINKSRFTMAQPHEKDELLSTLQNEIAILLKIKHPNIVSLYDVYESRDQLHLVMEYLSGGELFDRICEKSEEGGYGEKEAANIIKQILKALHCVHSKKILHLDLKPENIMFKDNESDTITLIDFGMARVVPRLTLLKGKVGTLQYMAPELIGGKPFSFGADVWSVGIILYCMIFGYPPFTDMSSDEDTEVGDVKSSEERIEQSILNGFDAEVKDGYGPWFPKEMPISKECMHLIKNMLNSDPAKRWTVKECLSSKWIQQIEENTNAISPLFKESLLKYRKKNKFRVVLSNLFCHYLDDDIKQEIAKHFKEMDTNNDGKLSLKEFEAGLKKLNSDLSSDQIELIFKSLDFDNDLTISLNELLISTNMTSLMARDERLYAAFEKLDTNKDGRIDRSEMEKAAKELFDGNDDDSKDEETHIMTLKRLNSAFDAADKNNDGTVDYDEFLQVLHPEMKDKEKMSQLMKQSTVEDNYGGAKFNISNKRAKGSFISPKQYKSKGLLQEIDEEQDEFNDIDRLEKENGRLKEELKTKEEMIDSLQQSLKERDEKLEELKALIKQLEEK